MERSTQEGREMETKSTEAVAREYLEALQEICKRNPPTSVEWLRASKEINALCATMARR
jgi:hypothetical protein